MRWPDPLRRSTARVVAGALAAAVAGATAAGAQAAGDDGRLGRWSAPFWEGGQSPFDPPSSEKGRQFPAAAAATVLPDGRLLYWNGIEGSENGDVWIGSLDGTIVVENARVRLLDMRSPAPRWTTSVLERGTTDDPQASTAVQDLFCSDQKLLHDGRVLVAGGSRWDVAEDTRLPEPRGVVATRVFDPRTNAFVSVEDMREPRWYPSLVTLADGRVAVVSGVRRVIGTFMSPEPALSQVRLTEIHDPGTGTWEDAGVSESSFPLYPRLHLMPDGDVAYLGAGQSWNPGGGSFDEHSWGEQRLYDAEERRWRAVGRARYDTRSGAASVMLPLTPPYRHADILMAGGTLGAAPSTWLATTLSEVVRWTPEGLRALGEPKSPVAGLSGDPTQLRQRRWFGTPLMLPTGEVLLINGGDADDVVDPGSAAPVRRPELYDPRTGTWTVLAASARDRVYHNSAVLLPDGRVVVGGNIPHPAHFLRYGAPSRNNNFRDATFEIFEPPYLHRGRRPVVRRVRPVRRGRALRLTMRRGDGAARRVSRVNLVRLSSNTHSMDADMRAVELRHSVRRGGRIVARLPRGGDAGILPPGPYYVFAVRESSEGPVPSVGRVVTMRPAGDGRVVARRLPRAR